MDYTVSNLQQNTSLPALPDTDSYFNNFYTVGVSVPTDTHAIITTFFETYTNDKDSAKLLTQAVIYTALAQKQNPMEIVAEFKKLPPNQLNLYLVTFLNLSRENTSALGVTNTRRGGFFVERSILA